MWSIPVTRVSVLCVLVHMVLRPLYQVARGRALLPCRCQRAQAVLNHAHVSFLVLIGFPVAAMSTLTKGNFGEEGVYLLTA